MFVDINLEQTKVPAKLLWELYPEIYSPDDPSYSRAIISKAVENLVRKELKDVVSHISLGSKGPITFHALCSELERTGILKGDGKGVLAEIEGLNWEKIQDRLEIILAAFFDAIYEEGKAFPAVRDKFFLTNSGMIPLIRELGKICKYEITHHSGRLSSNRNRIAGFFAEEYLRLVYASYGQYTAEQLDNERKTRVGSAGFIHTEDRMDDVIRKYIPAFPLREKRTPPELDKECRSFTSIMDEINAKAVETGKLREWVFREFASQRVLKQLSKAAKDLPSLERFIKLIHQEILESSGAQSDQNRICRILDAASPNDIAVLRRLSLLRQMTVHRHSQIDPAKRREAIDFLRELSQNRSVSSFDDLSEADCLRLQVNLLRQLRKDLLERLFSELTKN